MKRNILYISYNGLLEEIVPSQVIPYLKGLKREGYSFVLLTFERKQHLKITGREKILKIKDELKAIGIEWFFLRYHKRMPSLATSFDVLLGAAFAVYLVIAKKISIVHARSVIPAVMCLAAKPFGVKFIFDTRGILAEEYVGGGHWRKGSLKYRLTSFLDRVCLRFSDAVVALTEKHRQYLLGLHWFKEKKSNIPLEVIPCCVDLDRFKYRKKEFLQDNFIFSYLGKIGKHYMLEEMLDFFKIALEVLPNSKFMIISQSEQKDILELVLKKRLSPEFIVIKKPNFQEIPALVSVAHAGIFFINPYRKFGSSPIKLGEFLSSGVPVIINSGIGDTEELVRKNRVGVVIDSFNQDNYRGAVKTFLALMNEGEAVNIRCRNTAKDFLSLDMGIKKYNAIYSHLLKCTA